MSEKSRKDERSIEDKMREHWDELRNRAMNLGQTQYERAHGRDPENVIDGRFVEHPAGTTQDDIDQETLRGNEARLDRGEKVTPEMYRALDQIYHRHRPRG